MRIVLGAGRKVTQTCDLFNINEEIYQFYENPRYEGETKEDKPIAHHILYPQNPYVVHDMHGDCREKREAIKRFADEAYSKGVHYGWGKLIHPMTVFANPKRIGEDIIVRPFSIICSHVVLGDHTDIGNLCNIAHHCEIGEYSIVAGHVAMSGGVKLGEGVLIGQGVSIKPDIIIGEGAIVGTGAVVVKDVSPNTVVAGNPAMPNPKFKKVTQW